jgi:hypothetical protein
MIIAEYHCQMCDSRFEVRLIEVDDPHERDLPAGRPRCKHCGSYQIDQVRELRRESSGQFRRRA